MGDPKATSSSPQPPSSSSTLPPGCRFYPSEEQLISYYLHHKNNNPPCTNVRYDTIRDINLYDYNPFDMPEITCFRFGYRGQRRHWYCYTAAVGGDGDERERRRAGFGFWKRKGRVRDVMGCNGGKGILGRRKCFIFYMEKYKGRKFVRTDWLMYEYALLDNLKASFVVCRVFVKSRHRNSISEHALSSCGEESVATVRHIGIQHDGSALHLVDEEKHDYANETTVGGATGLIGEMQPNNLVTSLGLAGSTNLLVDSVTAEQLVSILEGDFLELDDLI
ncbi:NAC domain-containing protein 101-like [Silene latifolia]|uniref:NAC domain-containing protein 101-like n=1 Tax=Silene latifolia TaxID=37657 RepID=UPI003D784EE2